MCAGLIKGLAESMEAPTREASTVFQNGVRRADRLIVWKKKDTGGFLTYQWITDTYRDRTLAYFLLTLRCSIPPENCSDKRWAIPSQ
jgi:hypothetical protein